MLSFRAGGISSFPPCAREYRLLRRLRGLYYLTFQYIFNTLRDKNRQITEDPFLAIGCSR